MPDRLVTGGYYDRWKTSPPEPPEQRKVRLCDCGCDEWIYEGDDVYRTGDDRLIFADHWDDFVKEELGATRTNAEMEEPDYVGRGD